MKIDWNLVKTGLVTYLQRYAETTTAQPSER